MTFTKFFWWFAFILNTYNLFDLADKGKIEQAGVTLFVLVVLLVVKWVEVERAKGKP